MFFILTLMKRIANRMTIVGLILLIAPVLFVAFHGYNGKGSALKALVLALSGLVLAGSGLWWHHVLRRLDQIKERQDLARNKLFRAILSGSSPTVRPAATAAAQDHGVK
jgi:hypothetical protein